jgi:hypothetical protein
MLVLRLAQRHGVMDGCLLQRPQQIKQIKSGLRI